MKKEVIITFGIPMYNSEMYIKELLDCFDHDCEISYEILILNDGSKDNSENICRNYNNKNIRLINEKNSGVSVARNNIIKNALGKYLTFIDSDDLIDFKKYIDMVNEAQKNNYDLLINIPNNIKKKSIDYLIEKEIINSPCMKIYNTKLLRDNKILFDKNINLGEDLIFNIKYFKTIKNIGFYYGNIYNYRKINMSSLTIKYRKEKFETLMSVNNICRLLLNSKKINKAFEYIRIKNCFSCIKTEKNNKSLNYEYIKKLKKYKKREYLFLNSIKSTIIYNAWYILPSRIIYLFFK